MKYFLVIWFLSADGLKPAGVYEYPNRDACEWSKTFLTEQYGVHTDYKFLFECEVREA